jgi:transcriptional antiterminator Rof (Rho-off)
MEDFNPQNNSTKKINTDYKKIRYDVFNILEAQSQSIHVLTASLKYNEEVQGRAYARIKRDKDRINELEAEAVEQDSLEFILREKIDGLEQKIKDIKDGTLVPRRSN